MERDEARAIALAVLASAPGNGQDRSQERVILDQLTIERDFGWVFFYNTRGYVETGDIMLGLVGNAPLIVDREDGSVHSTGTAAPIEAYIQKYEAERSKRPPAN